MLLLKNIRHKMARKYDKYGRNRQFRRNPTRTRKFFPYRLPYIANFSTFRPASIQEEKKYDDDDGLYERMQYTQTPRKRKRDDFEGRKRKREPERSNPLMNGMKSVVGAASDTVFGTVLTRAAQGELRKDLAEIALRSALVLEIISL